VYIENYSLVKLKEDEAIQSTLKARLITKLQHTDRLIYSSSVTPIL